VIADPDLVVRLHTPEDNLPSLSWAAAEFLQAPVTKQPGASTAQRWLNYYGPSRAIPGISYYEALDPALSPDSIFKDKVVFVGARLMTKFAGQRKDEYPSPFSYWFSGAGNDQQAVFMSGVELQATAFLNLLHGDWLRRLPFGAENSLIVVLGLLFGFF